MKDTWQLRGIVDARKTSSLPACLARHPPWVHWIDYGRESRLQGFWKNRAERVRWKRLSLIRLWPGGTETNSLAKEGPFSLRICLPSFSFCGPSNNYLKYKLRKHKSWFIRWHNPTKKNKKKQQQAAANTHPRYLYYVLFLHPAYTSMCTVWLYAGQIPAMWVCSAACSSAITV